MHRTHQEFPGPAVCKGCRARLDQVKHNCLLHGCFACCGKCCVKRADSISCIIGSPDTAQRPPVCGVETTWRIQSVERVFGSQSLNTPPHADTHRESPAGLDADHEHCVQLQSQWSDASSDSQSIHYCIVQGGLGQVPSVVARMILEYHTASLTPDWTPSHSTRHLRRYATFAHASDTRSVLHFCLAYPLLCRRSVACVTCRRFSDRSARARPTLKQASRQSNFQKGPWA